jgi:integrase
VLVHDLAHVLQLDNCDLLVERLKWISDVYRNQPFLAEQCNQIIEALYDQAALSQSDGFDQRNEDSFPHYVQSWKQLIVAELPADDVDRELFTKLYLATSAASLLTIFQFQQQEKIQRKPKSLAAFSRAEIALRLTLNKDRQLLTKFEDISADLRQFLRKLQALKKDPEISQKIIDNRIEPLRVVFVYALGDKEGKHEHSKEQLPEILSIPLGDEDDLSGGASQVIRSRISEFGNTSHLPARENSYDSPAAKSYVQHPRAEKSLPTAKSPHLQNQLNSKISQRLVMSQVLTGANHKALSQNDVAILRTECLATLDNAAKLGGPSWENSLFIMLSLTTGRSTSFLRSLKVKQRPSYGFPNQPCWIFHKNRYFLYDVPQIPRGTRPDMIGNFDAEVFLSQKKTAGFFLPVPEKLALWLKTFHKKRNIAEYFLPETEAQTLGRMELLRERNVTLAKIQLHLHTVLTHTGVDDVIAGYICGKTPDQLPSMYYTQLSQDTIVSAYAEYVSKLDLETSVVALTDQNIGSMLVPKSERIKGLFASMRQHIVDVDTGKQADLINHHNYTVLYTYLLLCLSTGHRPVKAPFQYLRDFDLNAGFVWISDKVVRTNHASRVIPLCDTALHQMRHYVEHLQNLRVKLRHYDGESATRIDHTLQSKEPLLFLLQDPEGNCLTPKKLQDWYDFISALPGNWHRHMLRSYLTNKIPKDNLNAFMGHALIGIGPLSHTSGYSFTAIRSVSEQIEMLMHTHAIKPLGNLAGQYCIGPYETPGNYSAHIGRNGREKNRAYLLKLAVEKCAEIQDRLGFHCDKIATLDQYEKTLADAETKLEELNLSAEQFYRAKKFLQKSAKEIIDTHNLPASLPSVPAKLTFISSFRTEKWFSCARYIHVWDKHFYRRLEELNRTSHEDDLTLVGLILYSAATHGGLADSKMLLELAVKLTDFSLRPNVMGPYVWFDLDLPVQSKQGRYSLRNGNKCHRHRHWFVDEVSLALVIRLYKKRSPRSENVELGQKRLLKANVFELVKNSIFDGQPNETSITNLEELTLSAFWRHDCCQGPTISEALQMLASGKLSSFSIDRYSWTNLFSASKAIAPVRVSYRADERKNSVKRQREDPHSWGAFYENELIPAVRPAKKGRVKITTAEVITNLLALRETTDLPRHLQLAIDWLIDVAERNNKPSTIQRYCASLVSVWLLETNAMMPNLHDEDVLEEIYDNLLAYHSTSNEVSYMIGRLADFHTFGVKDSRYRLPEIKKHRWHKFKHHTRVRTKILSFKQVQAAIGLMTSGEPDAREKRKISLFVTLAYRTGMRLLELVKLRVKDVEPSDDFVISIRDNQFGNNKSRAGRRQINLRVFLSDDELNDFRALMKQTHHRKNHNEPIFSFGSTGMPYHGGQISRMFSDAIFGVTGDEAIVFHSLRHSCFSCLHAVLEDEPEIANVITELPIERLKAIREHLMGHPSNQMGLYYTLAAFAGHAEPKETMLSYLHLSDLILFKKLQKQKCEISTGKLAQIAGVQGTKLDGLCHAERYKYIVQHKAISIATQHPYILPAEQGNPSVPAAEQSSIGTMHDLILIAETLQALEKGSNAGDLAFLYDIDRALIEKWHDRAIALQKLKTRRGNPRLRSKSDDTSITMNVANDNAVRAEFDKVCRAVQRRLTSELVPEIGDFALAVLVASSPCATEYRIHDPAFAAKIVDLFSPEIPTKRWQLDVVIREGDDFEAYRQKWKHHVPWLKDSDIQTAPNLTPPQIPGGIGHLALQHGMVAQTHPSN